MRRRIVNAVAVALLGLAADLKAQQIAECKSAQGALENTGVLGTVRSILDAKCQAVYGGVWFTGTTGIKTAECDAWMTAIGPYFAAAKEFATRNCPAMYLSLGWRTGPAVSPPIPACNQAYNALSAAGQLGNTSMLLKLNCQEMYDARWLSGTGAGDANCTKPWSGLQASGRAAHAQNLINHNCPVMYSKGWVTAGFLQ